MEREGHSWKRLATISLGVAVVSFTVTYAYYYRQTQVIALSLPKYTVRLLPNHAEPDTLSVAVGDIVEFASRDGQYHNIRHVTGEDISVHEHAGAVYSSGVFGPDEAYRIEFKKPGQFNFHDHLNPTITIRITVQ